MLIDISIVSRAVIDGLYLNSLEEGQGLVHQASCISQSFCRSPRSFPQGPLLLLVFKQDLVDFEKELNGVTELIYGLAVFTVLGESQSILLGKHGCLAV